MSKNYTELTEGYYDFEVDYKGIGERIRKIRRNMELTQEQLAELTNISATHMSHIETACTKLSLLVCMKIANALNVTIDELVYEAPRINNSRLDEDWSVLLNSVTQEDSKKMYRLSKYMLELWS